MTAVSDAVEQIISHFSAAQNQAQLSMLGDSSHTPACAQLALSKLCPALYAVLSDGLHPTLNTAFGSIQNSVWQVVEASAQQGEIFIYISLCKTFLVPLMNSCLSMKIDYNCLSFQTMLMGTPKHEKHI